MQAITRSEYGGPEVLRIEELPRPKPHEKEILIKVYACTVNRTDCGVLWGAPFIFRFFVGFPRPRLAVMGTDFAGEVVEVGKAVSKFKVGDRVFGFHDNGLGSYAGYFTIKEDQPIATIPEGISWETAVATAEGGHYAYNYIRKLNMGAGQRIMVNGGTGAIGSAAIQMLVHRGAEVDSTCRESHIPLVKKLGARQIFDYETEDFTQSDMRYDFVFDSVGKSSFGKCKRLLLPGGYYLSSELGPRSENPFLALIAPLMGQKKVAFPVPTDIPGSLAYIRELLAAGALHPLIDRSYRMEEIQEAFAYVNSGQKVGNVILQIDQ